MPGRTALASFDDLPTAALLQPALTCVRLPALELGRRAVTPSESHSLHRLSIVPEAASMVISDGVSRTAPPAACTRRANTRCRSARVGVGRSACT
ncbi:substrate-binding domain-containing protein [Streptomyces sp. NPDC020298]|uniref:substrate-binding domain-containing protein n=1 Tax=unclassified Streptomyces TaxID=2593676 RepID=UPI0033D24D63